MPKPITDVLRHLEGGCFIDEATDQLAELVKAVETTGKAGKITLEIAVRRATAGALALTGKVKASIPPEPPMEALMFPTPEGSLLTEDPRQQKLELKAIEAEPARQLKQLTN